MGVRAYSVNIVGLTNKAHQFSFEMGDAFFEQYGRQLVSQGSLKADVTLDKHETFIDATFLIHGSVKLTCDRSLDTFDHPIDTEKKLVFKYGDANQELSDEIVMIHRDSDSLELGQYIFEFIALEIPMKKLHPRFRDEEEEDDDSTGKIIYTSKNSPEDDRTGGNETDPRWDILKKLK